MNPQRRTLMRALAGAGALCASPVPALAATPLYRNARASTARRVDDLLRRMTLDEKLMQLQCIWNRKDQVQDAQGAFSGASASAAFPHGIGMLARPSDRQGQAGAATPANAADPGDSGARANRGARETAEFSLAAQRWAVEHTRLGIPLLLHEEALHGYAAREATCFPQAIALASSFDPALVTEVFGVVAAEMRARGANLALAPVVDVAREPRWGRIEETFSEDPYLCGVIGVAVVRGLSGDCLPLAPDKVLATLKHMTGHGQPENGTNIGPLSVGQRDLRQVFYAPFEYVIRRTVAAAVMPSYNEVDGVPSHANRAMLTGVLRQEWGFKGIVVSDYGGIGALVERHHLAADMAEAGLRAFAAGVDVETPDPHCYPHLAAQLARGAIALPALDAAVRRILHLKVAAGLFEQPYPDPGRADAATATPAALALARRAATRCAVLLKNDADLLPLEARTIGRLLVVGTHARDTPIGGYSDVPRKVVSVLEALQEEAADGAFSISYSEGVRLTEERIWGQDAIHFTTDEVNARLREQAVAAAAQADLIVMVLGDNEQTSREAWGDHHLGDRSSLGLIGQQDALAAALCQLGKPVVAVLLNGRPLAINLLASQAGAILEGWYLGQETGHAVADLLFGRANPGGKLPVSIARDVGQLPLFYNHKPSARRGYLDGVTTPLYPFGFGLSYTRFTLSAPRLSRTRIRAHERVTVSVEVHNTGARAGDEVVQLYVRDDISSATRPERELKAFERVSLEPGQRRTVHLELGPEQLRYYDADMVRRVEPGNFTIFTGADSGALQCAVLTVD